MGGKSQVIPKPEVADDTQRTISNITLVDVISEGPILGLVDGAKSVYINNVQWQQPSGQFNINGFKAHFRYGLPEQEPLPFRYIEQTFDVNENVKSMYNSVAIPVPGHLSATVETARGLLISNNAFTTNVVAPSVKNQIKIGPPGTGDKQTAVPTQQPVGSFVWNASVNRYDAVVANPGSNVVGDGNSTQFHTYYYEPVPANGLGGNPGWQNGPRAEIEGGVVRTITNPNAKFARIILKIDKLYQESGNGDVQPATLRFAIQYKRPSDTYWQNAEIINKYDTNYSPPVVYGAGGAPYKYFAWYPDDLYTPMGIRYRCVFAEVTVLVAPRSRYDIRMQGGDAEVATPRPNLTFEPTEWYDGTDVSTTLKYSATGYNGSDLPQVVKVQLYSSQTSHRTDANDVNRLEWNPVRVIDMMGGAVLDAKYAWTKDGIQWTNEGGTTPSLPSGAVYGVMSIFAKTQNGLQLDYVIALPARGTLGNKNQFDNIQVRVVKLTPDDIYSGIDAPSIATAVGIKGDAAEERANFWITYCSFMWSAYIELIENTIQYSDTAVVGIELNSQWTGSSVPTRAYDVYGRVIRVPSNYDGFAHVYTGLWDGTFVQGWTSNPVWIFLDLLTNDRYGLGQWIRDDLIDLAAMYQVAQYCDEMVQTDGDTSPCPRFEFNTQIISQEQAYNVLAMLSSAFRGMIYWAAGGITLTQDSPKDPTRIVSPSNVINGDFQYTGSALQARHSVVLVSWSDQSNMGKDRVDVYEDPELIDRYGYITTELKAWGCTRYSQAMRMARWLLETEKNATELVTYRAGFDHADARPGEVVAIADPMISGMRHGGRIVQAVAGTAVFTLQITMDAPFKFNADENYTMSLQMASSTMGPVSVRNGSTTVTLGPNTALIGVFDHIMIYGSATRYKIVSQGFYELELEVPYSGPDITNADYALFNGPLLVASSVLNVIEVGIINPGTETDTVVVNWVTTANAPNPNAEFIITGSSVKPRLFTIVANKEIDTHTFEITALEHDPTKFDRVELQP